MNVTFYHSILCPRCCRARKHLHQILKDHPEITLKEVNVLKNIRLSFQDGVRLIPAMKINDTLFSKIILSESDIKTFIESKI